MMQALGASSVIGLAGCGGSTDDGGNGNGSGLEYDPCNETYSEIIPMEQGVEYWGERLNCHAREADVDWEQFADDDITLTFGMGLHPYEETTRQVKDYFTELTGIEVEYVTFTEERFWREAEQFVSDQTGEFDGIMNGLWPAGGYHELGAVRDLKEFIVDDTLTDQEWLHLEDFREDTKHLMTFPNTGENIDLDGFPEGDFVGFPNGIEAYGCVGYHMPTYEQLGLSEPVNFEELRANAQIIAESDEVDRGGIVSRTSSGTLSAANWGTMFKTYQANWIDRQTKEATINSEEGVESLELFGEMLNQYGPPDPGTRDWYANNDAYSVGDVAMIYSTPQTSGVIDLDVMQETRWLAPLQDPYGNDPIVDTWIWATGISTYSENPGAAWLYLQWANSREANYMLSTKQWEGDQPRAGYARLDYCDQRDDQFPIPGEGYMEAFREGMDNVPSPADDPPRAPPVPVDTPQNMNIMSEAAQAMSSVVRGEQDAQTALDNAAPAITEHAQQIPDEYLAYLQ